MTASLPEDPTLDEVRALRPGLRHKQRLMAGTRKRLQQQRIRLMSMPILPAWLLTTAAWR